MNVTHFTVPRKVYPRYAYACKYVTPLLQRFKGICKKCDLNDPFEIPNFDDVNIYVIFVDGLEILSTDDITTKKSSDIKVDRKFFNNVDEFRRACPDVAAAIHVISLEQAKANGKLIDFSGQCNVHIVENTAKPTSPDIRSPDNTIICFKTKTSIAEDIGELLERLVFKQLFRRVKIMHAFLEEEPAVSLSVNLDRLTNEKLKSATSRPSSANITKSTTERYNQWCNARLSAIKEIIQSRYWKEVTEIREQLLQADVMKPLIDVTAYKTCEQILQYEEGEDITVAKHVPKSMLDEVEAIKNSHQTQSKSIALENRLHKHLVCVEDHKSEIEKLLGACMGMYYRSKVPEFERPQKFESCLLKEEVAKEILSINGVTGCGFRYRTLEVYARDTLNEEEMIMVGDGMKIIAEKHSIMRFMIRTEQAKMTPFATYEVGSKVTCERDTSASVGGFGHKGKGDLVFFTARHFTDGAKALYLKDETGKKSKFASVLESEKQCDQTATLDIAAAMVLKAHRRKCQTQFKDSEGDTKESKLAEFGDNELDWWQDIPVHIWGATTRPGLGTLILPEFYVEGMKKPLVKIEDKHPEDGQTPVDFSAGGDSGAIVCADDPEGKVVYVISMIMGSSNYEAKKKDPSIKGEYLTFRLTDGLLQLEEDHDDTFKLC